MDKLRINIKDILLSLTNALDIISPVLTTHNQQVACLSFHLSEKLGLPTPEITDIFLAALIHDSGALTLKEKLELVDSEPEYVHVHSLRGAKLFEEFKPLKTASHIVKYHHIPWNFGEGSKVNDETVNIGSHIIHLADRVCAKIDNNQNVLTQVSGIQEAMQSFRDVTFVPELVDALNLLKIKDFIWLDLVSSNPVKKISDRIGDLLILEMDDIIELTRIFSHIIDFRSKFTARHSAGVAKTAEKLAALVGFSAYEQKMMLIAGYLHDIGKLAISDSILEKPGKLNTEEFNEMRSHTYYTYKILDTIPQLKEINTWASYHHEKLDGTGYPFQLKGDSLSLGSRIMAVADVFAAITENRPYRIGMDNKKASIILKNMVKSGALEDKLVSLAVNHFDELNLARDNAQKEAKLYYDNFFKTNDNA